MFLNEISIDSKVVWVEFQITDPKGVTIII